MNYDSPITIYVDADENLPPNALLTDTKPALLLPVPTVGDTFTFIHCRVCQHSVSLQGKAHQNVVKCNLCKEVTPIKCAPVGKKYVCCQCNLLLICKATAQLIPCPRPSCKRIINLGPVADDSTDSPVTCEPIGARVICIHCSSSFLWTWTDNSGETLAQCPHCKKISYIGHHYPRRRSAACCLIFLLVVFSTVGIVAATWNLAQKYTVLYLAWAQMALPAMYSLTRAIYWMNLKTSDPVSSVTADDGIEC
ncbi:type I phosphatidylinositol 4,5-bisphosphate 4-phosphatase-A-like [Neosynchiropus ocellatus]